VELNLLFKKINFNNMNLTKFFLLLPFLGNAQQSNDTYRNSRVIEIGTHGLSVGYDILIGNKSFLNFETGVGGGYNLNDDAVSYILNFSKPTPYVKSSYSFFYNKDKRISKGKSLKNNSGNFIEAQLKYSFGNKNDIDLNKSLLTDLHWGIQRSIGSNFYFRTHVGIGYLQDFDLSKGNLTPTLGFKFGYNLL